MTGLAILAAAAATMPVSLTCSGTDEVFHPFNESRPADFQVQLGPHRVALTGPIFLWSLSEQRVRRSKSGLTRVNAVFREHPTARIEMELGDISLFEIPMKWRVIEVVTDRGDETLQEAGTATCHLTTSRESGGS
jgi:hypothetical protein